MGVEGAEFHINISGIIRRAMDGGGWPWADEPSLFIYFDMKCLLFFV